MDGRWRWRDLGRPEAALVGAQYVDWNHNEYPNRPFIATGVAAGAVALRRHRAPQRRHASASTGSRSTRGRPTRRPARTCSRTSRDLRRRQERRDDVLHDAGRREGLLGRRHELRRLGALACRLDDAAEPLDGAEQAVKLAAVAVRLDPRRRWARRRLLGAVAAPRADDPRLDLDGVRPHAAAAAAAGAGRRLANVRLRPGTDPGAPGFRVRPPFRRVWTFHGRALLEFPPVVGYGRVYITNFAGASSRSTLRPERPFGATGQAAAAGPRPPSRTTSSTRRSSATTNAVRTPTTARSPRSTRATARVAGSAASARPSRRRSSRAEPSTSETGTAASGRSTRGPVARAGRRSSHGAIKGSLALSGKPALHRYLRRRRRRARGAHRSSALAQRRPRPDLLVARGCLRPRLYRLARRRRLRVRRGDRAPALGARDGQLRVRLARDLATSSARRLLRPSLLRVRRRHRRCPLALRRSGPISGSASVIDGLVYFSTFKERTYALDAANGRQSRRGTTGSTRRPSPTASISTLSVSARSRARTPLLAGGAGDADMFSA